MLCTTNLLTVADKVVVVNPFDAFVHCLKCSSIDVSSQLCTACVIDINSVTSSTNIIQYVAEWYVRKRINHYCSVVP